jgi:hypothetical protein
MKFIKNQKKETPKIYVTGVRPYIDFGFDGNEFQDEKVSQNYLSKENGKTVKAIQATYENFENLLFFMGKSRRVDIKKLKENFLTKGSFEINFCSWKNPEIRKINLNDYIVRDEIDYITRFFVYNNEEFLEKFELRNGGNKNDF